MELIMLCGNALLKILHSSLHNLKLFLAHTLQTAITELPPHLMLAKCAEMPQKQMVKN